MMIRSIYSSRRNSEQGFTLIEVLIALLVLSFGLLGVAAMQLKAMQSAHVSYQRSVATLAAQDAVERLWIELGENPPDCPDASKINGQGSAGWHSEWTRHMANLDSNPITSLGCEYTIRIDWDDDRFLGENVSLLAYKSRLPGE